jgi:hypothetical protein
MDMANLPPLLTREGGTTGDGLQSRKILEIHLENLASSRSDCTFLGVFVSREDTNSAAHFPVQELYIQHRIKGVPAFL